MPIAEMMKVRWIRTCHITPLSVKLLRVVPRLPASMKVRSSEIEEMPMIAIASLILSTLALTWLSHSGSSGWPLQIQAGDEGLIAADDHHHQEVRNHDDVDQPEHDQHDLLLAGVEGVRDQVPELLQEQQHIDGLRDDEADIERHLQPARAKDQLGERADLRSGAEARRRCFGFRSHGSLRMSKKRRLTDWR